MSCILGIKLVSRKWRSTREAASCCQPVRHPPGSPNGGVTKASMKVGVSS